MGARRVPLRFALGNFAARNLRVAEQQYESADAKSDRACEALFRKKAPVDADFEACETASNEARRAKYAMFDARKALLRVQAAAGKHRRWRL